MICETVCFLFLRLRWRFFPAKNHGFLLEIFKAVREREPKAALLLVGEGPLQRQAAKRAVELGVADDVIMTGNRKDVPELLGAMDRFCFPSLWEGLPVTLVEAQAAGLPCIISDTITHDVDVSPLVTRLPPEDAERWADELLDKKHYRADATAYIVRSGFDVRSSAQRMFELYSRLDREAREEAGR